ncbi:DUF1361 domain-containing protein [Roseivirga sp. BDSF3-8]|uniref:DUF1361 domain-containing protein n=1 Tax=Roseivirga sp. BDSF3-8 TaxID=3241598 RepID=UPI00353223CB
MNNLLNPVNALRTLAVFSALPILMRVATQGDITGLFLLWNLFLAWLPLPLARGFASTLAITSKERIMMASVFFLAWLFFFPNAPYIVTDLIHLEGEHDPAYWLEATVLFALATTGMFTGMYSMYIIHRSLQKLTGLILSWLIMGGCAFLSGFGIYLGRIQRWNTWDIITRPLALLKGAYHGAQETIAIEMTIGFGLLIIICYFMLISLVGYEKRTS